MPRKKSKEVFPTPMYDSITFPNHRFDRKNGLHICKFCGFVLGSGGGSIPDCSPLSKEEIEKNTKEGIDIMNKLMHIE